MAEIQSNILDGIVNLIQGSTGSGRTITSGKFKHRPESLEEVGVQAAAEEPRPFELAQYAGTEALDTPSNVSGSHVYGAAEIMLRVGYAGQPTKQHTTRKTILDDERTIRRALEWPPNWVITSGWVGCRVGDSSINDITEDEGFQHLALEIPVTIEWRDNRSS